MTELTHNESEGLNVLKMEFQVDLNISMCIKSITSDDT